MRILEGGRRRARIAAALTGTVLVLAGLAVMLWPVAEASWRNRGAEAAVNSWPGASASLEQPVRADPETPAPSATPTPDACTSRPPAGDYALVTFPSLEQHGYRGVAADGTWDLLSSRSWVHHRASPAPGERGNVIIAFHREPAYEHIDELRVGDLVRIYDRNCHIFVYRITQRQQVAPNHAEQLNPTTGFDLTLITCTPWYQDYLRLIWRASLVTADARI
jgi:LPXTG-site transpeptidase (sortase) family protein